MSNRMITAAWDVPLPAHARLVLIALADSASEDEGICWISNRTIMDKACAGKSTVGYILAAFERLGIAVRETRFEPRKNGAQTSSIKRITIPVFTGSDEEIATAKGKFAAEYDEAYAWARSPKDTPSHEVVGEGAHHVVPTPTTQSGIPHTTLCGTPHTTLSGTLEPSSYPSSYPSSVNTPQGAMGMNKKRKKTMTLEEIADLHGFTVSTIEDYLSYRMNSGGIDFPDAFRTSILRNLADPNSDESVRLENWFEAWEEERLTIEALTGEFLSVSSHWFDRRVCRERGNDSFANGLIQLGGYYAEIPGREEIVQTIVIEIAYQLAEQARRDRMGGAA